MENTGNSHEEAVFKETFSKIDTLKILNDKTKTFIVLSYLGLKPVSEFGLQKDKLTESEIETELADLQDYLQELNLFCTIDNNVAEDEIIVEISKDREYLDRFAEIERQQAHASKEQKAKLFEETGRLFGYPETSIQAFNTRDFLSPADYKDFSPYQRKLAQFLELKFSRKFWKEELLKVEEYTNAVQSLAPHLYERIMEMPELSDTEMEDIFIKKDFSKYREVLEKLEAYIVKFSIPEITLQNQEIINTKDFFQEVHRYFEP